MAAQSDGSPKKADESVSESYRAVVAAVVACRGATDLETLEFRRTRREFDPTWTALQRAVVALAIELRDQGLSIEDVIRTVKSAVLEGWPELPPHNAVRSAAVGWCVAAFHGGNPPRSLGSTND